MRAFGLFVAVLCGDCFAQPVVSVVVTSPTAQPQFNGARVRVDMPVALQEGVSHVYPLISLKVCSETSKDCAMGIAKLKSTVWVEKLDASKASVRLDLIYQVGRSQTVDDDQSQQTSATLPTHVAVLHADQHLSKTAELTYGEVRHVRFTYGVDVAVCIAAKTEVGPDSCIGLETYPSSASDTPL